MNVSRKEVGGVWLRGGARVVGPTISGCLFSFYSELVVACYL